MTARLALAVAALAVATWLALGLRSTHAVEQAQDIATRFDPRPSAADVERASDLYDRGRRFQPDARPDLFEAGLLQRTGHPLRARRILDPLVAREPENVEAWAVLALASARTDPVRSAQARERVRALSPPRPEP